MVGANERSFYRLADIDGPEEPIEDRIDGQAVRVFIDPADRVSKAEWHGGGRPLQLFTRRYGFASTFPG